MRKVQYYCDRCKKQIKGGESFLRASFREVFVPVVNNGKIYCEPDLDFCKECGENIIQTIAAPILNQEEINQNRSELEPKKSRGRPKKVNDGRLVDLKEVYALKEQGQMLSEIAIMLDVPIDELEKAIYEDRHGKKVNSNSLN